MEHKSFREALDEHIDENKTEFKEIKAKINCLSNESNTMKQLLHTIDNRLFETLESHWKMKNMLGSMRLRYGAIGVVIALVWDWIVNHNSVVTKLFK